MAKKSVAQINQSGGDNYTPKKKKQGGHPGSSSKPKQNKPQRPQAQVKKPGEKLTYVLDTNVVVINPTAIFSFDEHDVVLTDISLEELDALKKSLDAEAAYGAREAVRVIDDLRKKALLTKGVPTPGGGTFRIELNHVSEPLPEGWEDKKADNRILRAVKALAKESPGKVVLVTNDALMRLKADIIGVAVEEYRTESVSEKGLAYTGISERIFSKEEVSAFLSENGILTEPEEGFTENEFVIVTEDAPSAKEPILAKYRSGIVLPLLYEGYRPAGITPKKQTQKFAIEALMESNEDTPLVILRGSAGTGKTLLALAVAMDQTLIHSTYRKILYVRPPDANNIGALPGGELDKIGPLLRPAFDNLEIIARGMHHTKIWEKFARSGDDDEMNEELFVEWLFEKKLVGAQAMEWMQRGRSITDTFVIVDEAQNATPGNMLSITTRIGEGSKLVLCGDPAQIDNLRLSSATNGLSFAAERMMGSELCAQITFSPEDGVRSPLATEASRRMEIKGRKYL